MRKIDFFIVGAQKAGTTSLYEYLKAQNEAIEMPMVKEVMEFSDPKKSLEQISKNVTSYYTSSIKNTVKIGMADVRSLFLSKVSAKNIYNYNREAKIIILLRDPVDRAISSFKYSYRNQLEEVDSFELIYNSIEAQRKSELKPVEQLARLYLEVSNYNDQIKDFLALFPREQICFLLFDDLIKNPLEETNKVFAFLGINHTLITNRNIFSEKFNQGGSAKIKWVAKLFNRRNILRNTYNFIPLNIRMKIRTRFINPLLKKNYSVKEVGIIIPPELKEKIKEDFRERVYDLEKLTGLDLKGRWGY